MHLSVKIFDMNVCLQSIRIESELLYLQMIFLKKISATAIAEISLRGNASFHFENAHVMTSSCVYPSGPVFNGPSKSR